MAKRLQNELLSQLEAISNIGIWEFDINSNKLYWSDGVFKLCGYEPQEFEVTFEINLNVIHPDDREFTIAQIENTKQTGKEFDVRKRFITKQGTIKHINSKAKLIKDSKGKGIKIRGIFQDITNTVELESALKKNVKDLKARNEFIETVLNNLPIGIAVNKIDNGEATLVNDQFAASYGWSNSDLADVNSFFNKVYPDETYRNEMIGKILSDIQSGNPDRMNWTGIKVTTSTGAQKIIDAKNIPLFEQNLMISTVVDVTEKVYLHQQKIAQEADLKALIENTPDIIYSVDMDFKLLTYNSVFYNFMLKLGRGKVSKGINVFDLYSPQKHKQYISIFDKVHQGNRHVFEDIVSFEGIDLYFEVAVNPIISDNGKQIGVSIFSKDITDKKKSEKELERIKKNHEAIINSTQDLIWSINSEMRLITSNKAYNKTILESTGRIVKEGDNILIDEYDEETVNKWTEYYNRGLSGETFSVKHYDKSNHQSMYMLVSFSPMYNDENKIWGLACNAKNITDETINLLNLQKKDAELEKIMNSSLDVICTFNKESEFVKVNSASERVWGYKPEELIGKNYNFLVHPDDINLTNTTTAEIEGGINVSSFENRNIKKDGTIIPMLWSANYDEKEEITYCVAKDVSGIKKTEEKLRLSEQYFKNLIQNGNDLVGILNVEGDYIYVSPSAHQILGIPAEELIGKNCFSFMHSDDKENIEQDFIKLATSQKVQFEPFRFQHNDGSWLWLEAIGTNSLDDEAINGIVINARDITDKVKKDEELENANKILKNAQKLAQIGNYELNLNTNEVFCSDEIYNIYEIDRDENVILSPQDFSSFTHPDEVALLTNFREKIIETGGVDSILHRIITKKNNLKYVRQVVELVYDEKTKTKWLYGTLRDSTSNILVQKEIEESEKKYKYLFDNNPSVMFIFDFETLKIIDCNQEALELYGYKRKEFLNLTIKEIRPAEDIDLINKVTQSEDAYGEIHKDIWRHKKKNGEVIHVHINGHLIDYADRRCSLVLVTDITEKLEKEKAIKTSEQQRELIMNAALDAIICIDKNGDVQFWNPQAEKIFDWISDEVIGKNLTQIIVPHQHRDAHDAGMKHYLKTNEGPVLNKLLELSALNKSGSEFPIELTVIPIKQGDTEFFCAFIRDITKRKKAEQLVIESEVRYRTMIESSMDAILLTVKNGEILSTNEAACQIFQMTREEVLNAGRGGLVDMSDPRLIPLLEQRERTGKARGELTFIRKDGSKFPGEITSVVFKDANGQERTSMIIRDISSQKNAEKEIIESNQRYNYVTKATSDAIWDWDLTTDLIYWGDGFTKIFGYEKSVIEPDISSWTNRIHPEDYPKILKSIHDYINNSKFDKNWYEEYRFLKSDGNYAFVQDKGVVIRNSNGDATRMVGALQDITKKKEEDLRLKLLESVVTNTKDGILITEAEPFDEPGPRILYVNDAFTKMTGYTSEDVIGKTPRILQGPNTDKKELKKLSMALRNWESCEITTINYKKNGEEFYINLSINPVANSKGWYTHWIAIERDVTESVLAQQRLKSSLEERNTILESIDDAFFAVDRNWIVNYWNYQAEKMLNKTKKQVIGNNLWEVFSNYSKSSSFEKYNQALEKNFSVNFEEYNETLDQWYDISIYPSETGLSVYLKDITERKHFQQQFESVINNMPGITYRCKMDEYWTMLFMSDGVFEVTGFPADNFVNSKYRTFASIIHYEDLMTTYNIDEALNQHEVFEIEYRIICADGSIKWVQDKGRGVYNAENTLLYIDGVIMDITDRKNSQSELEKAYQEKNNVLESIDDGFFAIDNNSLVTYWNKKAEDLLGEKREDVIGKNLHEMFANPNSMAFHDQYQKAINENKTIHFEEFSVRSKKWFEVSAFASDKGLSVYFKDITSKKAIEEEIKAERNLLRTLIDNLPDTIYVKDASARKVISNKNDYNLIGFEHEEDVIGKTDLELFDNELGEKGYNHDMEIIKTGAALINFEECYTKKDGSPLWLLTTKVPLKNNENKIVGILGIGRDITDIKTAQENITNVNIELEKNINQLHISNKELEQFAYIASHDLQEPLRMVTSFLTQIDKKYSGILDEKGKQYIHFAVDGAKRMRQIILDLLEFSRVGRLSEEVEQVDVNEIINEIQSLYRKQIDEVSAKFKTNDFPTISSFKTPIRQVLQNLISNALKYSSPNTAVNIEINIKDMAKFWEFSIKDNGIGIEEEYFQKIFIIFQRLHSKDEYSGTGMGLAICKKIIETLGGKIWVEKNNGPGSCFYFLIPKQSI